MSEPSVDPDPAGRWAGWGLPVGLVFVALAALASAYAPMLDREPEPATAASGTVTYAGFYGQEKGPGGLAWRWMSDAAGLRVRGKGLIWLGFRALSYRSPRSLIVSNRSGDTLRIRVSAKPTMHLIGPMSIDGESMVGLRTTEPPSPAPGGDDRKLSIFLSEVAAVSRPAVGLPRAGFFQTEVDAAGRPFNWMGTSAQIDVRVLPRTEQRAWITFWATSIDDSERVLTIGTGGVQKVVKVPARGDTSRVVAGPFPLRDGKARLTLLADPPGRSYHPDERRLTVQIRNLKVSTEAPPAGGP